MATILHAVIGYWFLLLTVRVFSRRPGAQMTPFEFVLIFLIGGAIILTTVGNDHSETNAVCAVIVIGLMHRIVSFFSSRYRRFDLLVNGPPLVLLKKGEWQTGAMGKMRIQQADVMAAARAQGVKTLRGIRYAILERLGSISIIEEESKK